MWMSGLLSMLLALSAGVEHPVLSRALDLVGTPYRYGGVTDRGFDCAGFVRYSYSSVGVDLPRTAASQFGIGESIQRDQLLPGDLVFFRNTYRPGISHVGLYVGKGSFVHAASSRGEVVVDRMDQPYFEARYAGARRVKP